jgi:hypothetical protein
MRGGEPIAAFIALLDSEARTIAWCCAGHPGACLIAPDRPGAPGAEPAPNTLGGGGSRLGEPAGATLRGVAPFGPGTMLVVASSGVCGGDAGAWYGALRATVAAAGPRLAGALVEAAANRGQPREDLLAVVVRQRRGDRRSATLSPQGVP